MTSENRPEQQIDGEAAGAERAGERDTAPPAPDQDPVAAAESRATAAEAKAVEANDRWLRAQAELDNVRKRTQRELADGLRYANEQLVRDLLPALDNLERALAATPAGDAAVAGLREGVSLTRTQVLGILRKYGVVPVEALGRPFDPTIHEAVQRVSSPEPEGMVVAEYQRGYTLNGRLVRPAMVAVAAPAAADGAAGDGAV